MANVINFQFYCNFEPFCYLLMVFSAVPLLLPHTIYSGIYYNSNFNLYISYIFSFGRSIGKRPWLTIFMSLMLCLICSSGNIFFTVNTDDDTTWTPYGSPVGAIVSVRLLSFYFGG